MVGLLGGIAAGKSFVASLFPRKAALRIDADRIAHRVLRRRDVRGRIRRRWGPDLFRSDGALLRRRLARRVFANPDELKELNRIVHPHVRAAVQGELRRCRKPIAVLDAALLLEEGIAHWCDVLVFVEAPAKLREARAERMRGWGREEFRARERRQASLARKRALADYVISNRGSRERTKAQVLRLMGKLLPDGLDGREGKWRRKDPVAPRRAGGPRRKPRKRR